MSVVGIDFGSDNSVITVNKPGGFKTVLNEASLRSTPSVVAFNGSERYFGDAAAQQVVTNFKNTIPLVKQFIGRKHADPDVQELLKTVPVRTRAGPDGEILFELNFLGETQTYSPPQILAMYFGRLKTLAEQERGDAVTDCAISIPAYFTESERRGILDAARIAGLNCYRLVHDTTAAAITWGIFKTELSETEPTIIAIVDIGHWSCTCSVFKFVRGEVTTLAHASDRMLGARTFDVAIANFMADQIQTSFKLDVRSNMKAWLRVLQNAEKLKKVLSANPQAPFNIDCLMEDRDVRGCIDREQLEKISEPIVERIRGLCQRALDIAGVTLNDLKAVEVIGGGVRIPLAKRTLGEFFGPTKIMCTMSSDECVSLGCALIAAVHSPRLRVREFRVVDSLPFAISLQWAQPTTAAGPAPPPGAVSGMKLFPRNNAIPSTLKQVTFKRTGPFDIAAIYEDTTQLPAGMSTHISQCGFVSVPRRDDGDAVDVKVRVRLDVSGCFEYESGMYQEEVEVDEEEVVVDSTATTPAAATPAAAEPAADANMANAANGDATPAAEGAEAGAETPAPAAPVAEPAVASKKSTRTVKKRRVRKIDVNIAPVYPALSVDRIRGCRDVESRLVENDIIIRETAEAKNALESYVYDVRAQLGEGGSWAAFLETSQRESFVSRLYAMEDWLYGDGESCEKVEYDRQLRDLRSVGDQVQRRFVDAQERGNTVAECRAAMQVLVETAASTDERYAHLSVEDRTAASTEAVKVLTWLDGLVQSTSSAPKHQDPPAFVEEIRKRKVDAEHRGYAVLNKPKPAPAPAPAAPAADAAPASSSESDSAPAAEEGATSTPMETDAEVPAAAAAAAAEGEATSDPIDADHEQVVTTEQHKDEPMDA